MSVGQEVLFVFLSEYNNMSNTNHAGGCTDVSV